jgi:aminoglycoside phosphotransferase (APT) family kinase protein
VAGGFPALVERVAQLKASTLLHGDAHVWNWMLPVAGTRGAPKLLDWDAWLAGPGAWDLAYMMALQWDRDVRQRFESKLLDRYHRSLVACRVQGYSREELEHDYRFAVLLHLRTPVARFARKMSAYVWWPQLARIRNAVEDLQCLDLLR